MASCESIKLYNIARDCENNMGGIRKVWLALWEMGAVALQTDASGQTEVSAITISSGNSWNAFNFRKGSSNMTSTLNVDDATGYNYIQTDLNMVFSRMETAKRTAVAALAVAECLGIVLDCNGNYYVLGVDDPVTATAGTGETGTARGDANQYSITLTDFSKSYPYFVPASVIESLNLPE